MPRLDGVLETALYVSDLDASARFYQRLFEFPVVVSIDRLRALRIADRQILLLFTKDGSASLPVGSHDGDGHLHLAFAIPAEELTKWAERLEQFGIPIEEDKTWDLGGRSLYFRDPDGHLIELGTPGIWPGVY